MKDKILAWMKKLYGKIPNAIGNKYIKLMVWYMICVYLGFTIYLFMVGFITCLNKI